MAQTTNPDTLLSDAQALLARIEASDREETEGVKRFITAIEKTNASLKEATAALDEIVADLQVVTDNGSSVGDQGLETLLHETEQAHDLEEESE